MRNKRTREVKDGIVYIKTSYSSSGDIVYDSIQAILPKDTRKNREAFGLNYGNETWELDEEEMRALTEGRTLAREVNGGEYSIFLRWNTNMETE